MRHIFGQPVRPIRANNRSVTGHVAVGAVLVPYESTLERDFVILCDFENPGATFHSQPIRIHYLGDDGRERHYTPDYGVVYAAGTAELVEVKFKAELDARWSDLEPKIRAGEAYAHQHGLTFRVVTDIDLRSDRRLHNANFLRTFRRTASDPVIEEALLRALEQLGPIPIRELLNATYPEGRGLQQAQPILWRLLGTGKIKAMFQEKVTIESQVWVQERGL